ncbi:UvrD-helicase domain-containing protein [Alteromonas sp. NFXS44]
MSDMAVRPNFAGKLFGKPTLTLTKENLVFTHRGRKDRYLPLASVRTLFKVKKRFLGDELRLEGVKTTVRYRFLKSENVEALQAAANKIIRRHLKAYLQAVFTEFNDSVKLQYPKDSQEEALRSLIDSLYRDYSNYQADWQSMLSADAIAAVKDILSLYPFDMAKLRSYHEQMQLKARCGFFDTVESNPLTTKQRLAVLRSNDRNMVLAAAGTGKTSVMVAKTLDLIDRALAKPQDILVLAYNRSASLELKARLLDKAQTHAIKLDTEPQIGTFHALGRQILQEAGRSTQISVFAENSAELKMWIAQWMHEYTAEDAARKQLLITMLSVQEGRETQLSGQALITAATELLTKALQAMRVEGLNRTGVSKRLTEAGIKPAGKIAGLLSALHKDYVNELKRQDCIDFDDLITRATELVEKGTFIPRWKYILVDEFQDISASRMALITALVDRAKANGVATSLTVVGDDWQSVYRFSGGKLSLTTRFGKVAGSYTETKLQKTFRYNNSIADTAGQFIMENPEQFRKSIDTHTKTDTPQIFLLDDKPGKENGVYERIAEVVSKIRSNEPESTVAVIARYNFLLDEAKHALSKQNLNNNVRFWSFHKSKGLEADHCILIGFSGGKNGFPGSGREDGLIEALLPSSDTYPHAEERRLMYVGLTRAKHKCYIIADIVSPSEFVTELLCPKYNVSVASAAISFMKSAEF